MKTDDFSNAMFFNNIESALKQYKKYIQLSLIKHKIDITYDQWQVLDIIVNNEDIKQTEIAEKTSKDTASVTRIIELLNKKGYVARQTDPNNRRKLILGVSNHGEKQYHKAAAVIGECTDKALSGLKEKRLKKLKKVFKTITKNCR
ncbi:MAG TPA: MarR family transcriptional regulator [Ignavibacteria bacterium]|nr:MarR family transcriptional regulator [Ignavibacteria bacterium]HMQ97649.1 MarR family transcriptional regulator [Ignavibacteria bacterium]